MVTLAGRAPVAQGIELEPSNLSVAGSNPAGGAGPPGPPEAPSTLGPMSAESIAERARRANGIPAEPDTTGSWPARVARSPWTWVLLVATAVYAGSLAYLYWRTTADVPVNDGVIPGINNSALREAARAAVPTLAFWIVLFVWIDRYRPQRPLLWFLALGWGASVSTAASYAINTAASLEMAITGNGDPSTGARAAIFVAPFVEEATKATILFWIAIALRLQLVSRLQGVSLAGLSAAGFAFTENILYYARAIVFASAEISAGDPDAAFRELVWLRGFWTAFGHPLFTALAAIGLVVGLRTRSKVVRVLAPLAGFLAGALLHMVFNTVASLMERPQQNLLYFTVGLPLFLGLVIHVGRQVFVEGRRVRSRLEDYVRFGWLPESDPEVFSRQRSRWRATVVAATWGWRTLVDTVALQRTLTELAYLRDAQVRGIVDAAGDARARLLLDRAHALRATAIADPRGVRMQLPKPSWPWRRRRAVADGGPVETPVPVGAAPGTAPLGSQQYSPVDPRWGPPKG